VVKTHRPVVIAEGNMYTSSSGNFFWKNGFASVHFI
jgi:hypothetical protein